jgi:excisionase family DNA binding protein
MTEPLTLSIEEAAELLGIGRSSAYEAARNGQLPTIRLGRRLLVPRPKLEAMLGVPSDGPGEGARTVGEITTPQEGRDEPI